MTEQIYKKLKNEGWDDKTIINIGKIIEAQNKFWNSDNILDSDYNKRLDDVQLLMKNYSPTNLK